ncbi:MAG TPA: poly-gamma-glutamate hydrolase family protein [Acidimicrobiia bacterium]|nr:poly-gamma-glutamate hydrolase family protein [Acidimicrobiia bacterium]
MLDQLLAISGVEERFVPGSRVGVCALHGGLEQGTAEIAQAAAERAGASYYAVVQPGDLKWHVPSHRYDPALADGLRAFLAGIDVVISVHGFGGVRGADDRWTTALLGGTNRELAAQLERALTGALPHYRWIADLDVIPRHLRGMHPANPVNLVAQGGVQIELPPRVRRAGADYDALVTVLATVAADARRRCTDEG